MYIFKKPSLLESSWHFLFVTHTVHPLVSLQLVAIDKIASVHSSRLGLQNFLALFDSEISNGNDRIYPVRFEDDACKGSGVLNVSWCGISMQQDTAKSRWG